MNVLSSVMDPVLNW